MGRTWRSSRSSTTATRIRPPGTRPKSRSPRPTRPWWKTSPETRAGRRRARGGPGGSQKTTPTSPRPSAAPAAVRPREAAEKRVAEEKAAVASTLASKPASEPAAKPARVEPAPAAVLAQPDRQRVRAGRAEGLGRDPGLLLVGQDPGGPHPRPACGRRLQGLPLARRGGRPHHVPRAHRPLRLATMTPRRWPRRCARGTSWILG